MREVLAYILIQIHYLIRPKSNGILSIYFHNPSKSLFEKILKWLVAKGYKFISIKELEYYIHQEVDSRKLAFISFDDGWKGNLELIESIENFKVPITIFIPTDAVLLGNYWWEYATIIGQTKYSDIKKPSDFKKLQENDFTEKIAILRNAYKLERSCISLEELTKISEHELITIGSHTITHPILKMCSIETQTRELSESKRTLSKWLNTDIEYLAYPNGDYDENTIEIAQKCGYKLCFTTVPGRVNTLNVNPLLIPRYSIYDRGGYFENISKILGIWQKIFKTK